MSLILIGPIGLHELLVLLLAFAPLVILVWILILVLVRVSRLRRDLIALAQQVERLRAAADRVRNAPASGN